MATRILSVLNQKGGVGKTTTCVNLGAALARRGFRVLLVDMDPQANMTVHLGLEPHRLAKTTYSLLLGKHGMAEAVHQTDTPGLRIVPSTLALANAEIQLASTVGRELVLREALEDWLHPAPDGAPLPFGEPADAGRPEADFVLIDCPPSLGTLTMNALCSSGEILLPIQTEFFALQGVAGILESVKAVQRLNRGLRLSMVLPSMVDRRTTLARDVIDEIRNYFGDLVTRTEIRKNIKLAEAPSHGKTVFEWDPRCNGAQDYDALAAEVLGELPEAGITEAGITAAGITAAESAAAESVAVGTPDKGTPDKGTPEPEAAAPGEMVDEPMVDEPIEAEPPPADSEPAEAESAVAESVVVGPVVVEPSEAATPEAGTPEAATPEAATPEAGSPDHGGPAEEGTDPANGADRAPVVARESDSVPSLPVTTPAPAPPPAASAPPQERPAADDRADERNSGWSWTSWFRRSALGRSS